MSERHCERCRQIIPPARIEAMPETRLCVACSQATGEFTLSYVPENLAKSGSLKKNYGSFEVKKARKPMKRKD